MTGFIRGLFGGNKNNDAKEAAPKQPKRQAQAYFLDPDDAQSLGDVEFMRKSFEIKRTFPKVRNNPSFSVTKQVTATSETIGDDSNSSNGASASSNASNGSTPSSPTPQPTSQPRRPSSTDSNMDMFRKMAKDMKR